jgi:LPS-assembly protein
MPAGPAESGALNKQASRFPLLPPSKLPCAAHARLTPLAASLATWWLAASPALSWAQVSPAPSSPASAASAAPGIELRMSPELKPPPRGDAGRQLPAFLEAQKIHGRPDLETVAEGDVEFRRGGVVIRADQLTYEQADDLAIARGNVRISRDGNRYSGPELQLKIQRFEGFFLNPTYYFARTGAGGTAQRIDFIDEQRSIATGATYTSCTPDGSGTPAWLLSTDRVSLDFATNEGIADGAVLRFLGVPILAAPHFSFPLTDARKSGWLPPTFVPVDSRSGSRIGVPYYWNIAPNRDMTLYPEISTRRGLSMGTEFRYLEPNYNGTVKLDMTPYDRSTGSTRYGFTGTHESDFGNGLRFDARLLRVSDDDYWKDFPNDISTLTPRLLQSDVNLTRSVGDWSTYVRLRSWQVLQTTDPTSRIEAPYERLPQIGAQYSRGFGPGLQVSFEGEFNRFVNPTDPLQIVGSDTRLTGNRLHALGSISRPFGSPGWTVTPKLSFNAASYSLDQPMSDGRTSASRIIPTFSLDSAWVFERDAKFFGRAVRQTLEPRLLYVNTPFRDQIRLPNFDASAKDFNFDSIFTENAFSGVDRVSDAHQLTAGVTTRVLDPDSGVELLRLGIAQRYLFREQNVTPDNVPLTRRASDLLLLGSTGLVPNWSLDTSLQYSPDTERITRSIVGVRYSPGPFRTISATYRLTRGLSEQVELGWQWPIYGPTPDESRAANDSGSVAARDSSGVGP